MKTLVVNNQKGGVGKTLLSVHVAWYLAEAGARVLVIDLDPQGNASHSLSGARALGPSSALFFEAAPEGAAEPGLSLLAGDRRLDSVDAQLQAAVLRFKENFERLRLGGWDYAVIDTPPTWSGRNYAALMVATSLVAPIELETYSLQGIKELLGQKATVERGARGGRPIDFLGLLPSRFVSSQPRQRQHLQELLQAQGQSIMFPGAGRITQRQSYAEALDQKAPVWTIAKTAAKAAAEEIRGVLGTIQRRLDGLTA
ncbi:ParA family protein (plasmid) [Brevundimonas staleyi]|uniref:ParA family protein n=1 Tax=Brevundimonas staleyi TaxID=74326 RepID=A0ABW0FN76_9CAUL